jgi:DNA-directed RNA polymerase beta' subunit
MSKKLIRKSQTEIPNKAPNKNSGKNSDKRPIKKRHLRAIEIEDILSFIEPQLGIPLESAISIVEKNKASLREQLKSIYIYPSKIPILKETIERQYYRSLAKPGDNVGIIAAQNIGKEQTQTTLDSFHKAGTSENLLVGGISRFNEILTMSKDPKVISSKIYFKSKYEKLQDLRDEIGLKLLEIYFSKLISQFNLYRTEELPETSREWHNLALKIYYPEKGDPSVSESDESDNENNPIKRPPRVMVYKLKKELIYEYKIPLSIIREKLIVAIDNPDIQVLFSPLTIDPEIHLIHPGSKKDILYLDKYIENIHLFGIPGIKNLYFLQEGKHWFCDTEGSNYKELLAHPIIDNTRTISTHVWDIYNTLGIEASREYLIKELGNIMVENNNSDIQIFVDIMTYSGILTSISRFGMKREQTGPISKATFEIPLPNFLHSALYGEKDVLKSVGSNIVYGKLSSMGTGSIDILYDPKYL